MLCSSQILIWLCEDERNYQKLRIQFSNFDLNSLLGLPLLSVPVWPPVLHPHHQQAAQGHRDENDEAVVHPGEAVQQPRLLQVVYFHNSHLPIKSIRNKNFDAQNLSFDN